LDPELTPVVAALANLADGELHALMDATHESPHVAPELMAWIDSACVWEINRRAGKDYALRSPTPAILPEEEADNIDALLAMRNIFALSSGAAHALFDAILGLLQGGARRP